VPLVDATEDEEIEETEEKDEVLDHKV